MNGLGGELELEDAIDVAYMLIKLRRAVHPDDWVDAAVQGGQMAKIGGALGWRKK